MHGFVSSKTFSRYCFGRRWARIGLFLPSYIQHLFNIYPILYSLTCLTDDIYRFYLTLTIWLRKIMICRRFVKIECARERVWHKCTCEHFYICHRFVIVCTWYVLVSHKSKFYELLCVDIGQTMKWTVHSAMRIFLESHMSHGSEVPEFYPIKLKLHK